ncbi:MAG: deoxyribodipyrimidine photo-lyase [Bdellovibrionaceae bacterium]|nr:deoxyribodipyrimidine photo-lyase [Pseudobdellovibrionaceae bacterium]
MTTIFWFRRDLRLEDNAGLYHALLDGGSVLGVFIFDETILNNLDDPQDLRVQFLFKTLSDLKSALQKRGSDLIIEKGKPTEVWKALLQSENPERIYTNHDYEPSAIARDSAIETLCRSRSVEFKTFKDQVIFERDEIVTEARKPYTVYTPYKKKWLASLSDFYLKAYPVEKYLKNLKKVSKPQLMPTLAMLGFKSKDFSFPSDKVKTSILKTYAETRDFPAVNDGTTHLGLHLRFGTVSIRALAKKGKETSAVWLSELIWRDFFMQVLYHFPHVEKRSFRPQYDEVEWRKSNKDFKLWSDGQTGYPLVDAGMRELNATGFMHNRVRMVTASFLCKHLLIYWYEGERYFAKKLLDYDLAANNGNWQWSAGTGCDAAPYFRVFNPTTQAERFDKDEEYIRKWVPEYGTSDYVQPMVEHVFARERALAAFKKALKK